MLLTRELIQNIILCLMALCIAWGLKYHYSTAHAENLKWILAPTVALVETITRHPFFFESNIGYINEDLEIIIAPACAGVNFLIAVFCMSTFCGFFKLSGYQTKCIWLAGCAGIAYISTITVNAARIGISIATISTDIHAGWFTPQRIHQMTGILIYFFFLSVFYLIIQKIIYHIQTENRGKGLWKQRLKKQKNRADCSAPICLVPLVCYWAITIAVPFLNGAHKKDPSGFIEHCGMVGGGSISIFLLLHLLKPILKRLSQRFSKQH